MQATNIHDSGMCFTCAVRSYNRTAGPSQCRPSSCLLVYTRLSSSRIVDPSSIRCSWHCTKLCTPCLAYFVGIASNGAARQLRRHWRRAPTTTFVACMKSSVSVISEVSNICASCLHSLSFGHLSFFEFAAIYAAYSKEVSGQGREVHRKDIVCASRA